MVRQRLQQLLLAGFAAVALIGTASTARATCRQVHELLAQGFSVGEVAAGLGAPVAAVQACLQRVTFAAPAPRVSNAAGPPPLGAAGPPPLGAAGPPPLGAAGPPPLGAPGPAPLRAGGSGSTTLKVR
jgi:hypothetical protein